jgi:hypothetical protein
VLASELAEPSFNEHVEFELRQLHRSQTLGVADRAHELQVGVLDGKAQITRHRACPFEPVQVLRPSAKHDCRLRDAPCIIEGHLGGATFRFAFARSAAPALAKSVVGPSAAFGIVGVRNGGRRVVGLWPLMRLLMGHAS